MLVVSSPPEQKSSNTTTMTTLRIPVFASCVAGWDYHPVLEDELGVACGGGLLGALFGISDNNRSFSKTAEPLILQGVHTDGWAFCRTPAGREGMIPLAILNFGGMGPPTPIKQIIETLETRFGQTAALPTGKPRPPAPWPRTSSRGIAITDGSVGRLVSTAVTKSLQLSASENQTPSPSSATAILQPIRSKLFVPASDVVIHTNRKLGEGGFGIVYVGTLRGTVEVAVKTFRGEMDDKTRAAFVREVQTWEGLVQRNVLPLMGFCVEPPMMITDLVKEGNLRQFLTAHNWNQTLGRSLLLDVATGLNYLHSLNILHGDLKSLNILVDRNKAMITDFGLSKMRGPSFNATRSSHREGACWTPGFIAPEVLMGEPLQAPADVFGFAMVCYEVLSRGKMPYEDSGNVAVSLTSMLICWCDDR